MRAARTKHGLVTGAQREPEREKNLNWSLPLTVICKFPMKLAIIILSGDTPEILFKCLAGIKKNVRVDYKIYLGYNGKKLEVQHQIQAFLESSFPSEAYKVIKYDYYNFAVLNNDIVRNHLEPDSDHLLFCNNDVIVVDDCVNAMVHLMSTSKEPLGTIGCRLLYEDGTIQHDGQLIVADNKGSLKAISH
jgi:hypothetical protein